MQKKLIALAVAGLVSTGAMAQVTLYGVADVMFTSVDADGKKRQNNIDSGGLSGSRIGLKGSEDLGGGLSAVFTLEYAIAVDENAGIGKDDTPYSTSVARQQFVGLSGGFGTVVAGRLQTAGYDWMCAYDPVAGSGFGPVGRLGASTTLACGSGGRRDNAFAYQSPVIAGGLKLAYNHARITEDATGAATGKDATANMFHAAWSQGPLAVGAIYSKVSAKNTTADDDTTEIGVGGSFDLKVAKVFATYQRQEVGSADADSRYSLSVSVPVGSGAVWAQYAANSIDSTTATDDSKGIGIGYNHMMSKRTTLYAAYSTISNDSGATRGWAIGTPTAGGDASNLSLGIRHTF